MNHKKKELRINIQNCLDSIETIGEPPFSKLKFNSLYNFAFNLVSKHGKSSGLRKYFYIENFSEKEKFEFKIDYQKRNFLEFKKPFWDNISIFIRGNPGRFNGVVGLMRVKNDSGEMRPYKMAITNQQGIMLEKHTYLETFK